MHSGFSTKNSDCNSTMGLIVFIVQLSLFIGIPKTFWIGSSFVSRFSCFRISSIFLWFVKNSVTRPVNCIQADLSSRSLLNDGVEGGDDRTVGGRDIGNCDY